MTALTASSQQIAIRHPFPGLISYDESNAEFFFGRETHIEELKLFLSSNRLLSVMGNNESGKSSLIHAGLIHDLKKNGFEVNGRKDWNVTAFTPRNKPISDLALALAKTKSKPSLITKNHLVSLIHTLDTSGSQGIVQVYKSLKLPPQQNILIVIDQFDELFRQLELDKGDNYFNEAQRFINLLLHASRQQGYPIYFLLSMRPDLAANAARFPGLPDALNRGQYVLPPLTEEEIKTAIDNLLLKVLSIDRNHWLGSKETAFAEWGRDSAFQKSLFGTTAPPLPVIQVALQRKWQKGQEQEYIRKIENVLNNKPEDKTITESLEGILPEKETLAFRVSARIRQVIKKRENLVISETDLSNEIAAIIKDRKDEFEKGGKPSEILTVHAREVLEFLLPKETLADPSARGSYLNRICEKIFKALIHTSVEASPRPVRPVLYHELKKYLKRPENKAAAGLAFILPQIEQYRKELAEAAEIDPKNDQDLWAKDPIGSIMLKNEARRKKNEASDRQFEKLFPEQQDQTIKAILQPFLNREVAILDRFNQSPLSKNDQSLQLEGEGPAVPPIMETTSILLANEYLLDPTWGWDDLVKWKNEEEEAAMFYHKLLDATADWQASEDKDRKNKLWTNPTDLGNSIRWLIQHTPNATWAQRYDMAYKQSKSTDKKVNFEKAMGFLSRSIEAYKEGPIKREKQKINELKKERTKKRVYGLLAFLAFLIAIWAFSLKRMADRAKTAAFEASQEAEANERRANGETQKATYALIDAEEARKREEKAKETAVLNAERAIAAEQTARENAKKARRQQLLAEKERAQARLSELEAKLQTIRAEQQQVLAEEARQRAEKSSRETRALRDLELVRKQSLNAELLVLNGQAEKVSKEAILDSIKGALDAIRPTLDSLSPEYRYRPVKEYAAALQAYYFFKYPEKIVNTPAAIRAIIPLFKKQQFILGNENGTLSLFLLDNHSALQQGKPFSIGAPIRSMAISPDSENYLAIGTTDGDVITASMNFTQNRFDRFKELDRFSYPRDSLVVIEDIFFLKNNGQGYDVVVNKDRSRPEENTLEIFPFDTGTKEKVFRGRVRPSMINKNYGRISQIDATDYDRRDSTLYFGGTNLAIYSCSFNQAGVAENKFSEIPCNQVVLIPPNQEKRDRLKESIKNIEEEQITALKLVTMGPDRKYLAVGLFYGDIYLIDLATNTLVAESTATHYSQISGLDTYQWKGETYLAASSFDHSISLVNLSNALKGIASKQDKTNINIDDYVLNFKLHSKWVHGVQFFEHDGQLKILSISEDAAARIWLVDQKELEKKIREK